MRKAVNVVDWSLLLFGRLRFGLRLGATLFRWARRARSCSRWRRNGLQYHRANSSLGRLQTRKYSNLYYLSFNLLQSSKFIKWRTSCAFRSTKHLHSLTWTLKNGPMICTVVSSSCGVAPCSGNLITLPVTLWSSRTFWPPFPMMRPTCELGTKISTVSLTSSEPATKPSSRIFSKIKYCAYKQAETEHETTVTRKWFRFLILIFKCLPSIALQGFPQR